MTLLTALWNTRSTMQRGTRYLPWRLTRHPRCPATGERLAQNAQRLTCGQTRGARLFPCQRGLLFGQSVSLGVQGLRAGGRYLRRGRTRCCSACLGRCSELCIERLLTRIQPLLRRTQLQAACIAGAQPMDQAGVAHHVLHAAGTEPQHPAVGIGMPARGLQIVSRAVHQLAFALQQHISIAIVLRAWRRCAAGAAGWQRVLCRLAWPRNNEGVRRLRRR